MFQTKLIRSNDEDKFETDLNQFLSSLEDGQFLDIQYSTVAGPARIIYSALVIYEPLDLQS